MAAVGVQLPDETEVARIIRWRRAELERAGYDKLAATTIAMDTEVDLHLATDLLRRGCSPKLALRILL